MVVHTPFNPIAWAETRYLRNQLKIWKLFLVWGWGKISYKFTMLIAYFTFSTYLYLLLNDFPSLDKLERLGIGIAAFVILAVIHIKQINIWSKLIKDIESKHSKLGEDREKRLEELLKETIETIKKCQRNQSRNVPSWVIEFGN